MKMFYLTDCDTNKPVACVFHFESVSPKFAWSAHTYDKDGKPNRHHEFNDKETLEQFLADITNA